MSREIVRGAIGIDFGTSKTSIAYLDKGNTNEVAATFSTTVNIDLSDMDSGEYLQVNTVGGDEQEAWRHFKLDMGLRTVSPERCGAPHFFSIYAPHHLAAVCLREAIKKLYYQQTQGKKLQLSNKHSYVVKSATISVPAMWNFAQRRATVFAARVAGIKEVNLIEEPVAAYQYLVNRYPTLKTQDRIIYTLVFDLGGGTCDMVIIKSEPGKPPVVINRRMALVGGRDIDEAISGHWERGLVKLYPNIFEGADPLPEIAYKLMVKAKETKHDLNPMDRLNILQDPCGSRPIASPPPGLISGNDTESIHVSFALDPLSTNDFDDIVDRIWNRPNGINDELDRLLESPEIKGDPQNINRLIMVGGSSYVRLVICKLKQRFSHLEVGKDDTDEQKTFFLYNPKEAIALGASLFQFEFKQKRFGRKKIIRPTYPFNTLIELDFNPRDSHLLARMPAMFSLWLGRIESFHLDEKMYYYILGQRNQVPPSFSRPRLVLPIPSGRQSVVFKIYQTTWSKDDILKEYYDSGTYLLDATKDLVDEIEVPTTKQVSHIIFYYKFDEFGGFKRFVATYPRLGRQNRTGLEMPWNPDDSKAIGKSYDICFKQQYLRQNCELIE